MELDQFSIKKKKISFLIKTILKPHLKHRTLTKLFSSLYVGLRHLGIFMNEDLSEEMFQKFKDWIEG